MKIFHAMWRHKLCYYKISTKEVILASGLSCHAIKYDGQNFVSQPSTLNSSQYILLLLEIQLHFLDLTAISGVQPISRDLKTKNFRHIGWNLNSEEAKSFVKFIQPDVREEHTNQKFVPSKELVIWIQTKLSICPYSLRYIKIDLIN